MSIAIGDGLAFESGSDPDPSWAGLTEQASRLGAALQELAGSLDQRLLETESLGRITAAINQGLLLDEILDQVFVSFRGVIPYDRIGFSLIEPNGKDVVARWARSDMGALQLGAGYRAALEGSSLLPILQTGKPRIINDLRRYLEEKPGSESTRLIVAEGLRASLTCPLTVNGEPVGFMFFSSARPNEYGPEHVSIFESIAAQLSVIVEKGKLASELDARKQEAEHQNQELRRLNTIKNRFLGMVAHDLRNPIASIKMSAELLTDPSAPLGPDEKIEFLSDIDRQAAYMLELINDLLDVSKIESGRLELDVEPVQIGDLLAEAAGRHNNLAARKGTKVLLRNEASGSAAADPKRLRQVLDNLISNAVKFSPAGSAVRVGCRKVGGNWRIEVTDEGPGLTESDRAALFEYFATLSAKPTGGEASTGLGMAITRRVVEAHGGEIGVDSAPGRGSTFWFTIPAHPGRADGSAGRGDRDHLG